jgi:V8-like Glu-specific endopeptidase
VFTGTNPDLSTWDWSGSGTLVGPNLLLTASHVVPWAASNAGQFWWMKFVAGYADGNGVASSYVQTGYGVARYQDGSGADTGHDVAICRLYSSIGQTVGWMGSQSWGDLSTYVNMSNSLFSIGYPGAYKNAEEPEWAYFPNLHDTDDDSQGAIELECDEFASPGWSGGPIYGPVNDQWTVVGVCSDTQSEYVFPFSEEHDSVFAGGSWMVGLIQYGLANWPST